MSCRAIARKDFSQKTLDLLSKKGIEIVGAQAVPSSEGDVYFQGVAYILCYKEKSFIRTHSQVLIMAKSSWSPESDTI